MVAFFVSLFSEVSLNPGIFIPLGRFSSSFVTVVVAYTSPSGIPSLTVISALSPLIVVVEPISLLSLSNSLTVVVILASVGMPLPTDTVTFCPVLPARLVRLVSITGFCGLTLMVTIAPVVELSEYVPLMLWVITPTVSVFGTGRPFQLKVGCFSSLLPFLTVTKLSIFVNGGNGSPTVVLMVLPVRGCSLESFGFLVTLTLTLRVVTLPEPSSEVMVTSLLFILLVTSISPDESGSLSLPAPCLVIGASVKPEMLNFSI